MKVGGGSEFEAKGSCSDCVCVSCQSCWEVAKSVAQGEGEPREGGDQHPAGRALQMPGAMVRGTTERPAVLVRLLPPTAPLSKQPRLFRGK